MRAWKAYICLGSLPSLGNKTKTIKSLISPMGWPLKITRRSIKQIIKIDQPIKRLNCSRPCNWSSLGSGDQRAAAPCLRVHRRAVFGGQQAAHASLWACRGSWTSWLVRCGPWAEMIFHHIESRIWSYSGFRAFRVKPRRCWNTPIFQILNFRN